jgi:hypothetical protein
MLGLTVPHVGVDEVIASAVCCGAFWSLLEEERTCRTTCFMSILLDLAANGLCDCEAKSATHFSASLDFLIARILVPLARHPPAP